MKNFAPAYLLVALTVGQSLAANISPPVFARRSIIGGPDLGSEASGLEKRAAYCLAGDFMCAGSDYCCPFGTQCLPGAKCGGKSCGAGSTKCYESCCDVGFTCQGPNQPCLKVNTILIPGGVSTTSLAPVPGTTLVSSSTTTIPTTTGAATPGTTLINTYTTIPIKSTSSIAYPVPTPPSTALGGYPNSTVSSKGNSSSIPIIPVGGGNSLKPGAWLGALGAVFFFAFFHM